MKMLNRSTEKFRKVEPTIASSRFFLGHPISKHQFCSSDISQGEEPKALRKNATMVQKTVCRPDDERGISSHSGAMDQSYDSPPRSQAPGGVAGFLRVRPIIVVPSAKSEIAEITPSEATQ